VRKEGQEKGEIATKGGQLGNLNAIKPEKRNLHDEGFVSEPRPLKLSDIGVDDTQSHRWQTIADMPDKAVH